MTRATRWVASGVLLLMTASGCNRDARAARSFSYRATQQHGQLIPAAQRRPAGALSGEQIWGGATYTLSSDRGNVVVLNYFASWCGPCQVETPAFQSMYLATRTRGVSFVGLDVKDPSRSAVLAWLRDKHVTFPVVFDVMARTAQQLGGIPIAAIPNTVLIDRKGRVAAVYVGPTTSPELRIAIGALLAES